MKILSLCISNHDSSFSIMENGEITGHFLAERFSGLKKDPKIFPLFKNFITQDETIYDLLIVEIFNKNNYIISEQISDLEIFLTKYNYKFKRKIVNTSNHHIYHSYSGFYTSSFDESLCFVFDGNGSFFYEPSKEVSGYFSEIESIFLFKEGKLYKTLYRKYINFCCSENTLKNKNIDNELSIGIMYHELSKRMGFHWTDSGKVMGLGQYKNYEHKLPEEYNTSEWRNNVNEAYMLQNYCQDKISSLIEKYSNETGIKNIILTGGVSLNCVANYFYAKKFPDLNFHVDPFCSDKGISIGSCLYNYSKISKEKPKKIITPYLGFKEDQINFKKYNYQTVNYADIANLISKGNIVALFQGKSESGERSLGNRSLLFDPRVKNGKDIVNKIKKRESFRPFAATILLEYAKDWFDLESLNESPYMSFAVTAKEKSIELVPAIIHVNNTSRIQTVTKDQNYHFYNLIKSFYELTTIPMLLNTSFNLAGKPLVETFDDAMHTIKNSDIQYLYLPEYGKLIYNFNHS
jgi:carbamoyltransferase